MQRIKALGVALFAVLAVSAGAAAASQAATEGPFYKVGGVRLKATESKELKAQSFKKYVFSKGVMQTSCTQKLAAGAKIIGSTGANAGASEETIVFEGCTVVGNGVGCEVEHNQFTTSPLLGELGYENKEATETKERGPLVMLLKPVSGTWFATIKFVGACTQGEAKLLGSVAATVYSGGKAVEVGKEPAEQVANVLKFGPSHTQIWIEKAGVLSEVKPRLESAGTTVGVEGQSELWLAGELKWGVYTH